MRILADTNITAPAVQTLRAAGHDVLYAAERSIDPGDAALLQEASVERRVFLSKDHDIGTLVFRDAATHAGVMLIDDVGDAEQETSMILYLLESVEADLLAGMFVRGGPWGWRLGAHNDP